MARKTNKNVLTPVQWDEFLFKLEGPAGCNFRKNKKGETRWNCKGGRDRSFAEKILREMQIEQIEQVLAFCDENGGYCDCEILFNVADRVD